MNHVCDWNRLETASRNIHYYIVIFGSIPRVIRSHSARLFPAADFLLCSRRCDSEGFTLWYQNQYFISMKYLITSPRLTETICRLEQKIPEPPNFNPIFYLFIFFFIANLKKCGHPIRLKNLKSDCSDRSQCHPVCCNTSHMFPAGGAGPLGSLGGGGSGPGAPGIIGVKPSASFLSTRAVWRKTRPTKQRPRPLSSSGLSVCRGAPGPLSPLMGIELIISNNIIVLEQPKEQRNPPGTTEEEKRRGGHQRGERERTRGVQFKW